MRAINTEALKTEMRAMIEKPSHYTLIDSTRIMKDALYLIEKLLENEKNQFQD